VVEENFISRETRLVIVGVVTAIIVGVLASIAASYGMTRDNTANILALQINQKKITETLERVNQTQVRNTVLLDRLESKQKDISNSLEEHRRALGHPDAIQKQVDQLRDEVQGRKGRQ